ncbi:MAG: sigma 54-interacting transcriptional regulator [Spirochaetes bacterium]|nr:sigma 54-interacting transcriptional regulator [Spirochaetota bacterium]
MSRLLHASTDIGETLSDVVTGISRSLGLRSAMLTVMHRKSGEIIAEASFGISDEERDKGRYRPGEGIVGRVVETGEPIVVPRIADDPRFLDRTGSRRGEDISRLSFICLPVKSGAQTVGALCADIAYDEHTLDRAVHVLSVASSMIADTTMRLQLEAEERTLTEENRRLTDELNGQRRPASLIGTSQAMQSLYELINTVAGSDIPVFISGETGTGKELTARAIHQAGPRRAEPFAVVRCSALPENILTRELFGGDPSEPGGLHAAAGNGSLLLDEIGGLPHALQSRLLGALHDRDRAGVTGKQPRIIASTGRDMQLLIDTRRFHADLYYRLNGFTINVPPLRERKSDIPLLSDHFIERYNRKEHKNIVRISTPAIDALMSYHWPGNVRELEHCIERGVILSSDGVIHSYHLPPTLQTAVLTRTECRGSLESALSAVENEMLVEALKRRSGSIDEAARDLGLTEHAMMLRIKKHRIEVRRFIPESGAAQRVY